MTDRFVTEKEIDEERQKRQEEWATVRKAEDPVGKFAFLIFLSNAQFHYFFRSTRA
jgi:hypothetical protein